LKNLKYNKKIYKALQLKQLQINYCYSFSPVDYYAVKLCFTLQALLIAEEEPFQMLATSDNNYLVEIRNGYFGWTLQLSAFSECKYASIL